MNYQYMQWHNWIQKYFVKLKKPYTKQYMFHSSTYMNYRKDKNKVLNKQITVVSIQGFGKRWLTATRGIKKSLRWWKCSHHNYIVIWLYIFKKNNPLQYSCLENPMDEGAWWAAVHGVAKSQTRLSNFTFPFHFHVLEKEMATHSSVLAWWIPGTREPGRLQSMWSRRVGHDWTTLLHCALGNRLMDKRTA